MAEVQIILNSTVKSNPPYFVDDPEVDLHSGDSVVFIAKNSDFQVQINNADEYFDTKNTTLKYYVVPNKPSSTPQVLMDLPNNTEIVYDVYCNILNEYAFTPPTDAPPKMIVKAIIDRSR